MTTQLQLSAWHLALRIHPKVAVATVVAVLALAVALALAHPTTVIADPIARTVV